MFNWFSKKPVEPALQLIIPSTNAVPGIIVPTAVILKPKKWVTVKGRVGIVTKVDSSGYVKVDMTNPEGVTVETIRVNASELKLAKYVEIPESRRGNQVVAATLGYV